jgi:hypothetical protein
MVRYAATLTLTAYPPVESSPRVSLYNANEVLGAVQACVNRGLFLAPVGDANPVRFSKPTLIPLFDYDGVPLEGPGRAGPDDPYGYMDVDELTGRVLPDVDDDARFSVVMDFSLSFFARGAVWASWEAPTTVAVPPSWADYPPGSP